MASEDFKRLVQSLRVALAVTDAQGRIGFANAAFEAVAGMDAQALAGASLPGLVAAAETKRLQQAIARVAEGKAASAHVEAELAPPGIAPRWMAFALQPSPGERDQPAGVVVLAHDIAAQRETDAALEAASARLFAALEAASAGLLVESPRGDIELANEAFCRLLQLESAPQSLTGLPAGDTVARAPGIARAALERLLTPRARGPAPTMKLPSGAALERRPILADGVAHGALWVASSQAAGSEVRRAGAEMGVIERIGEELSVALEGLSAIAIRAQQMEFDPALVEHFQRIRESTETAMAAIGDLVDFSTLSGGIVLRRAEFGLRAALAQLVTRVVANAEEAGCRLRMKVEQDVSDRLVGDVDRLQLLLKNLLDNAFQLCPGAEVTLQITPEYVTESGIQLSFCVATTGAQAQAAKGSAEAGMGVALARFMVGAMGGKLAIAPRVGQDPLYSFTIEFPVRAHVTPVPRPTYVSLVGMPVLLVSRDMEQRLALATLMRGWRMVPLEADNAAMALALLERLQQEDTPVPLVILSNRLPLQDGFLLAFRIKHHPRLAQTLVMMLASEGRPGDAIACRENGIAAYMRYPVGDRQMNEAIVAVTGASLDADETPTLVTRHSLREQRKGATVLLVDAQRDSQILAAHMFGRDYVISAAHDLAEAEAALDQDTFDMLLVDVAGIGADAATIPARLRARMRHPAATRIVATSAEHSAAFHAARLAEGFDATLAKPFRKEPLLALLDRPPPA